MTMGRRQGISRVQIIVLVALAALALVCVFSYVVIARVPIPFLHAETATNTPPPTLANVALSESEIEDALQSPVPLTLKSSQKSCDIEKSLECFQADYTSSVGDLFNLSLSRFSSTDGAVNFGIAMKVQQEQEGGATEMDIPTVLGNFRWLDVDATGGTPVYHGGANANSISVFLTWGRTSVPISGNEAVQAFSRLLDAQIAKIQSRYSD